MHGFGWFGGGFMMFFWWIAIAICVALFFWMFNRTGSASTDSQALEALKIRYARGEISKEEYEYVINGISKD